MILCSKRRLVKASAMIDIRDFLFLWREDEKFSLNFHRNLLIFGEILGHLETFEDIWRYSWTLVDFS